MRDPASEVVQRCIEEHGPELLSFLASVHGSRDDAAEVFAETCEDLITSLPKFRRECSERTWLYALAVNASRRHFKAAARRPRVRLSQAPELAAVARTTTEAFRRTGWKDRFRALREQLEPFDRALLVLRVDRQLPWEDVALALAGDEGSPTAAALRKRFERIKTQLRDDAARAGWFDSSGRAAQ